LVAPLGVNNSVSTNDEPIVGCGRARPSGQSPG
jgi:hypothetical protein